MDLNSWVNGLQTTCKVASTYLEHRSTVLVKLICTHSYQILLNAKFLNTNTLQSISTNMICYYVGKTKENRT